ncbi:uncharacterized protein LOC113380645 [Ctenocephalides felis]|uniref:uncharacterized protein LOC113380645 n=1 Tax=Ctenocephalides felis TaxID=7515 RepID=UPI000E6E495D|nr:uncharacterized protein LOC113380645 [Ctenocephalides felis]
MTMETQNILIEKRRLAKSKITRTQNYISKCTSELSNLELNARKQLLNDTFNKYNEAQDEFEIINLDEFEGDREELETQYCKILCTIDILLAGCRQSNACAQNVSKSASAKVQLPQIHLPNFDGDLSKWPEFRDMFSSLIIENKLLTNSQKLHYLKNSLQRDRQFI